MFKSVRSNPTSLQPREYVATAPPALYSHEITKELREAIRSAWKNKCAYCKMGAVEHVDHVFPKSRGGPDCLANYAGSCVSCNTRKSNHILPDTLLVFIMEEAKRKVPAVEKALNDILAQAAGLPKPPRKPVVEWHDVNLPFTRSQLAKIISLDAIHDGSIPLSALGGDLRAGISEAQAHGVSDGAFADRLRFMVADGRLETSEEMMNLLMMGLACSSNQFRIRTKKGWHPVLSQIEEAYLCPKYVPIFFNGPIFQCDVGALIRILEPVNDGNTFVLPLDDAGYLSEIVRNLEGHCAISSLGPHSSSTIIERRKSLGGGRWDKKVEMDINPIFLPLLKRSLTCVSPSFVSFLDRQAGPAPRLADLPSVKMRSFWDDDVNESWKVDWSIVTGVSYDKIIHQEAADISFEDDSEVLRKIAA